MGSTIDQWIEKGKDLPVLSGSIADILSLTDQAGSNVSQIAEVIKKDISLSAAILRITNSSAFGLKRKITTIDQAVVFLGFQSVRNIALGVGVLNLFSPHDKDFFSRIWCRSLVTGLAARELCMQIGNKKKEDAFTIGLLLDIGLIAFYGYDKKGASELLKLAEDNGKTDLNEEKELIGLDHVEAGMRLAKRWGLPEDFILAIRHHHHKSLQDVLDNCNKPFAHIVYLSSLVGDIFYLGKKKESIREFTDGCRQLMEVSPDQSDNLLKNIHPQLTEVASYFDIAVGSGNRYEEILRSVNEEIVNVTISNEAAKRHLTKSFERERALKLKLENANKKLKILASKDALTGLFNRHFLNELLEKEWLRAQRHSHPLSVVMADIDDFKKVNDDYGHPAGDLVLKKIADVLMKSLRKNDLLARYGGEEFLFVLPQTTMRDARIAAERFKAAVRELKISFKKDEGFSISISCGVSTANPDKNDDELDSLIQRADYALYEAKGAGKDQVVYK
jgi:two-component system, cell cycle response regulator